MTRDEVNEWLKQWCEENGVDYESCRSTEGTHDEKYVGNANQNSNTSGNSSSNSAAAEPTPVSVAILTQNLIRPLAISISQRLPKKLPVQRREKKPLHAAYAEMSIQKKSL